jgi:hypothetical protein
MRTVDSTALYSADSFDIARDLDALIAAEDAHVEAARELEVQS